MFREIIFPIFRSTRLRVRACGIMHPRCCRPPAGNIVGATLPPSCAVVMKSGNLNFLEPSGPLQACNGTDFFTDTLHSLPHAQNRVQSCIVAGNYTEAKNRKLFNACYFSLVTQNAEVWHDIQCRCIIRYS